MADELDFTIYEDPVQDPDASSTGTADPGADGEPASISDEIDNVLAKQLNTISLSGKKPIAWIASDGSPVIVKRDARAHRFVIEAGQMRCDCFFVPGSDYISIQNKGKVPIQARGQNETYNLAFMFEEQLLSPGLWQLVAGDTAPAAALRICPSVPPSSKAIDIVDARPSCKRQRVGECYAATCRSESPPRQHIEALGPPVAKYSISYRKQHDRKHGKIVRVSLSAALHIPTSCRAQMWNCCVTTLLKLDHLYVVKLLHSDARDLSLKMRLTSTELLTATDEDGFYKYIDEADDMFNQMASAVVHVHKQGLAHFDIGPQNIVRQNRGHYKLSGFWRSGPGRVSYEVASEPAPWLLAPEFYDQSIRDPAADVFALGVVAVYAAGFLALPDSCQWWDAYGVRQGNNNDTGKYLAWKNVLRASIKKLLVSDRRNREAIGSALSHYKERPNAVKLYEDWLKQTDDGGTLPEERMRAMLNDAA